MTIPSATMRRLRLKQATAASRASQAAAPAPVLRPPPAGGGGGSGARGPAGRVHRTPPSSDKRQATTGEGGSNGGRDQVRAIRPAPPVPASAGKRCGTAPPASGRAVRDPPPKVPSAPPAAAAAAAAAAGGNAAAVAVGHRVLVRTPVTPTLAGQHVVITLGAEVVSAVEEDGESYFDVVFDGEFPPHDPSSTVRITRDEIVMTTPAAATNPSPSSATTTSTTVPAPARPGKREAVGSAAASSLRGAGQQRSLQIVRSKRSRY
ncbi:hypothetical protein PAHAL_1G009500 [Panicum hallii]|uniref:Uncharacterized protein n=1 Tax=Panicum hallii TaxID=206008 RepID=A0A2S3GKR7_9POAL|nr:Holliday junction resolvase MOC1, chloroplastic-like [Panicum hallii]XP_025793057.1 Holliday junction resolvase MOC1, chloroplastic-like [Panicum hallii]PAN03604.1 hypothetical protein PAHAL_1G009500 [Panicum hallii]